ncbi:HEPN domain-containing protein [Pannus brasiliensis CCIBt3594]|uniref:HEPN domain-containing protein n=1 Tax=Pannus brasiliensis CCIBt3594 TaxID=1427578 RepID=A0AAW9QQL3_9CHRO
MTTNDREEKSQDFRPPLVISSEEEFLLLMEDIDREMANEGISITARPFMAGLKITKRYDIVLNALPPRRPHQHGCFDPLEISIRVHNWIERRYGDRLKVPFRIGQVVCPLRGDLFVINCPTIYGAVHFICEPQNLGKQYENIGINQPPISNIINFVEDLTLDFASSLSTEEFIKIYVAFMSGMGAYLSLKAIQDIDYINEANGDFNAAVFHLMEHRSQPGLSKWSSLQAVEKLLKSYIALQGGSIKRTHSLRELSNQAKNLGLPEIPQQYIEDIQCLAGVRYGEITVLINDAVKAHLLSLEICEVVAQCIGKNLNRDMPVVPELEFDGMPLHEFLQEHAKF